MPNRRPFLRISNAAFLALLALSVLGAVGCQSTVMQHHFAAVDLDARPPVLNLYRISVEANSRLARSTYQSGLYDADALHRLFGEVRKEEPVSDPARPGGNSPPALAQLQLKFDAATRTWEAVKDNVRFTVVYGVNADALAQQIQLFADSDQAGEQIGRLFSAAVGGSALIGVTAAEQRLAVTRDRASDLAKFLRETAGKLDAAKPADDARRRLLEAIQKASFAGGSTAMFDTSALDTGYAQAERALGSLGAP